MDHMKMFKDYLGELKNGRGVVYDEKGFATYEIIGEECYIVDIYVSPDFREKYNASRYADLVVEEAKKNNCTVLTGSVVPSSHNATKSLKILLGYGFKLHSSQDNFIVFAKEISNE